jgi:Protein of unknown function (DUF3606)
MDPRRLQELNRIGIKHEWELRGWSREFGVTPQELKAAIAAVGVRVDAVRRYFAERKTGDSTLDGA